MTDRQKADWALNHLESWGSKEHTKFQSLRDKIAWSVCNWILTHVGTWEYQQSIYHLVEAGREAVREQDKKRKA